MDEVTYIIVFVGGGSLIIAALEWFSPTPPAWVWKTRQWINRRKK